MREPRKFSIGNLLQGNVKFVIPDYQRGYDWKGDSQVRDLFADLTSCIDSTYADTLFLGTMIFDVSRERQDSCIDVIDGQQRLTTLLITLMAARDYARDILNDEALAQSVQRYISNTNALSDAVHHRLEPSLTIVDIFAQMCDYGWERLFPTSIKKDGKNVSVRRQVSRLKPIYDFCTTQISSFCALDITKFKRLANQIIEHTFIIRIDIEDRSEAFEIFERTNARGKGLEVSDLLKNFLFSKEKEYKDESVGDVWDEIVDGFGDNLLQALKYFWISRKGAVTSRDLYRNLRYYAGEIGVSSFIVELREFSKFYHAYHSDDSDVTSEWLLSRQFPANDMYLKEFRRTCSMLRLFGVTQVVPFVYSLMKAFQAGGATDKDAKKVLSMLRILESFHFVNTKVCNRMGNQTEKPYADFSSKLFYASSLDILTDIGDWFISKRLAPFEEFSAGLAAISYRNRTERVTIRYVFDKLVNIDVKDGQRIDLVDIDAMQRGIRSSYDIEHLLCQSEADSDETHEFIHQIGNLIVIPRQINGIMSNASFEDKMNMLREPWKFDNNIKHVPTYLQEFVADYGHMSWDESAIKSRNLALAETVYQTVVTKSYYR
jgi:Protein of unknown function DUF262/Protein of unknown function (DUF1524)